MTRAAEKSVAIVQSCYIPWKGYFDLINSVDEFILFDDRQFTRRDWRNRNRIKTPQGSHLARRSRSRSRAATTSGSTRPPIADPELGRAALEDARARVCAARRTSTSTASGFEALYRECDEEPRSATSTGASSRRSASSSGSARGSPGRRDYERRGAKTERLVSLCQAAGATAYLSGPTARAYIDESLFDEAGIELEYMDYSGYPRVRAAAPAVRARGVDPRPALHTGLEAPRLHEELSSASRDAP